MGWVDVGEFTCSIVSIQLGGTLLQKLPGVWRESVVSVELSHTFRVIGRKWTHFASLKYSGGRLSMCGVWWDMAGKWQGNSESDEINMIMFWLTCDAHTAVSQAGG